MPVAPISLLARCMPVVPISLASYNLGHSSIDGRKNVMVCLLSSQAEIEGKLDQVHYRPTWVGIRNYFFIGLPFPLDVTLGLVLFFKTHDRPCASSYNGLDQ